jgi:phospholipid/cholesterol/gamma-HCH transport system substrate-binding protein
VALKKEVKTGIVVVVALSMLIFGLNFLKGINLFTHTKTIYAIYTDVQGVVPSNPIVVNGFHVGQIKKIAIEPNTSGKIVVTIQITNTDVKIPKNSVAKIFSSDFLGSKAIELDLGNAPELIQDGDTLPSSVEETIKETVDKQVLPLKKKVESLISSLDTTIGIIDGIFNKDTRDNLTQSIKSIRVSLGHIENTTVSVDQLMGSEKTHIASILDKVDQISTTLASNSKNLTKIITNFANISDTIAKANIHRTLQNADSALYYTSQIMGRINKGQGTLGMLSKDTALYMRLSRSSDDLDKLLQDFKAHPKRYVHFSVFGKKD